MDHSKIIKQYKKIGIIGAGSMGCGIAAVIALAGIPVILFDVNIRACEQALKNQILSWDNLCNKNKITPSQFDIGVRNLKISTVLSDFADADLIIEAIIEDLEHKKNLFKTLESICHAQTIFASNTSSLSITELSRSLANPARMIGLHFFNPPTRMKLVEIVTGLNTTDELVQKMYFLSKSLNKIPVITKSTPGFIVNRVARPFYAESLRVLEETRADADCLDQVQTQLSLDQVLRDCGQFPMGAFELMDLIGQDINFAVTQSVYLALYADPKFKPSYIQQELVQAGFLGRKSGRGFYSYPQIIQEKPNSILLDNNESKILDADSNSNNSNEFMTLVTLVTLNGSFGFASELILRLTNLGIFIKHVPKGDFLEIGNMRVYVCSGKTALGISFATQFKNVAILDLAKDYRQTKSLALAFSSTCDLNEIRKTEQFFTKIGVDLIQIPDVAGCIVMRTVAMLVSVATDLVEAGIANIEDIDTAMKYGTNHPLGPFEWADLIGFKQIGLVLENMQSYYEDGRYRQSRYLQNKVLSNQNNK